MLRIPMHERYCRRTYTHRSTDIYERHISPLCNHLLYKRKRARVDNNPSPYALPSYPKNLEKIEFSSSKRSAESSARERRFNNNS